jgi:hypothetical protein
VVKYPVEVNLKALSMSSLSNQIVIRRLVYLHCLYSLSIGTVFKIVTEPIKCQVDKSNNHLKLAIEEDSHKETRDSPMMQIILKPSSRDDQLGA